MDNFWTLLQIGFKTNLTSSQSLSTKKKAGSAAVLLVLVATITGYMFLVAYQMGKEFSASGMIDLLILFAVIGGVFFTFLNSVISSFHFVFKSKDTDILLSMPIKTPVIVSTKLLSVLALLYMYSAPIYIPFFTVYFIFAGVKLAMVAYAVLGFFLTPLFAFALGLALGMVLNSINSLRFAKPLYIIFMLAFIIFTMVISSNPQRAMEFLSGNTNGIINVTGAIYFPYYLLSKAIKEGNAFYFLAFGAINLLPILLLAAYCSKYYVKLVSFFSRSPKARKFEYKEAASATLMIVLLKKELKRLFSSVNYLINSCIGPLILIVLAIINMVNGAISGMLGAPIAVGAMLYISFTVLLNSPLAVSISLEGESFWIYKSIPVRPADIIRAKLLMQLIIFLPLSFVGTVLLCIAFQASAWHVVVLLLFTAAVNAFGAALGMTIGLKKYNLHYTNELQVVKQSSAVFITMIVGLLTAAAMFAPYMLLGKYISDIWYVAAAAAALAVTAGIMYAKLINISAEEFNKIT